MRAILALEDGRFFTGESFGATGSTVGEVCFNTSMTGYQEVLTDPSYRGQIVAMTAPQIGNYGVNELDQESDQPHVRGFVIEELSAIPSNWRATGDLDGWLKKWKIAGIQGIERGHDGASIRSASAEGCLASGDTTRRESERAKAAPPMAGSVSSERVTRRARDRGLESFLPHDDREGTGEDGCPGTGLQEVAAVRHYRGLRFRNENARFYGGCRRDSW
jgi:carbamoyl-phosphate synthase small subunit